MRRETRLNSSLAFFALFLAVVFFGGAAAEANEVMGYTGSINRVPISGCCAQQPAPLGGGMLVRLEQIGIFKNLEVAAFSDFKWSELSVGKYIYLAGNMPKKDSLSSSEVMVTYVPLWSFPFSYGAGFFSHSTFTKLYNRAVITNGVQVYGRLSAVRSISDRWFFGAHISLGVSMSELDTNFNTGYGLGLGFRF